VTVVVGSGVTAQRLSTDVGLRLLENSIATAAALPVLILVFRPVSGAHLNPVVSLADWLLGRRRQVGIRVRDLAAYLPAQVAGGVGGALLANAMFNVSNGFSTHTRSGGHLWLGEAVASAGLLLVICSLARGGKGNQTPWAVGAYIGAAYWFTSSTSFANPAVSIGRAFSNSFAGIAPGSVPGFILAECAGTIVGLAVILTLFPTATDAAQRIVVPHPTTEPATTMDRTP
jgi:arsenate reductase